MSLNRVETTNGHRTVDRVAAILEAAASNPDPGVRLATLAELLDAPKSSLHGLVKGLVAVGYLTERSGAYKLGPGLHALLGSAERPSVSEVARPVMQRLRDRFDETVMVGQLIGGHVVYIAGMESRQPIRYSPMLNQRRPVLPTSMGKIFVAELDERPRRAHVERFTSNQRRRRALRTELAEVRRTDVAINRNETLPGLCGVAVALRSQGTLVACLSVVGPTERMDPRMKQIQRAIKAAGKDVSTQL
jgi:DNA-binding IclR family transcriptional regulator